MTGIFKAFSLLVYTGVSLPDSVIFDFEDCGYSTAKLVQNGAKTEKYVNELNSLIESSDWSHPACSILLPNEKKFESQSLSLAKKLKTHSLIIVIGIGGSNLGTMAVCRAAFGNLYNIIPREPQILFADTVDAQTLESILSISREHAQKGGKILINVISKSGKTLETIVNFDIIYGSLRKICADSLDVVATCDEHSDFLKTAVSEGFYTLEIPKNVGGRYSVFSNVGLFPLHCSGIDTKKLLAGARAGLTQSLNCDLSQNPALLMASFFQLQKKNNRNIHVDFMFSNNLRALGYWYKQLLAESIGKEKNILGTKTVHEGITPLLSIGTTDLHAMAQLFLGGPDDKTYRFVSVKDFGGHLHVGELDFTRKLIPQADGKKVSQIMSALCDGTKAAYRKKGLPFTSTVLPSFDEYSLGQIMQVQMLEVIYLGNMLGVNAFDQPSVEHYKFEAKKALERL